jgi:hypothetical protein
MAQTYHNHRQRTPLYLYGVLLPFTLNFAWAIWRVVTTPSGDTVMNLLMAIAFVLMWWAVRRMVLTVQNRVIRLEMRLRLRELLPPTMQGDIARLSLSQLIALRFASDVELPALIQEVLTGQATSSKDIKLKIRDWQGDYLRA